MQAPESRSQKRVNKKDIDEESRDIAVQAVREMYETEVQSQV